MNKNTDLLYAFTDEFMNSLFLKTEKIRIHEPLPEQFDFGLRSMLGMPRRSASALTAALSSAVSLCLLDFFCFFNLLNLFNLLRFLYLFIILCQGALRWNDDDRVFLQAILLQPRIVFI